MIKAVLREDGFFFVSLNNGATVFVSSVFENCAIAGGTFK